MMKVKVTKNGLTMAKHNGLVVHVGHDDGQVIQEAMDYIEMYQSKWYRRIKRWFLRRFRKWDGVSLASGTYDIIGTINLSSSIILSGDHTTIQGHGNDAIISGQKVKEMNGWNEIVDDIYATPKSTKYKYHKDHPKHLVAGDVSFAEWIRLSTSTTIKEEME